MKAEWSTSPLPTVLLKVPSTRKIRKSEYLKDGTYPIVSQEEGLINGFWNDEADLFKIQKPVVIFGDHNQVIKFIDFDFVKGADGTKVLLVKPILEPKFFYYFLQANPVEAKGYARHFRFVKELDVPLPPLEEQKRIVAILDAAFEGLDRARAHTEVNLQNARDLFESYLSSLNYEKLNLGDFVNIRTGKLNANAAVDGGQYPFFTCSRKVYEIDSFAFDCEAILLAGNNASGDFNVKHYSGKFNAYQRTYVIEIPNLERLNYRFLYFQMLQSLAELKKSSVGTNTKFLKIGMIKDLKIKVPSISEQRRIVSKLDDLNKATGELASSYQTKLADLEDLRQSLLQKAFAGELT